jgi:hypothetical protein
MGSARNQPQVCCHQQSYGCSQCCSSRVDTGRFAAIVVVVHLLGSISIQPAYCNELATVSETVASERHGRLHRPYQAYRRP